jgi:hypothetical protein
MEVEEGSTIVNQPIPAKRKASQPKKKKARRDDAANANF